MKIGFIGAGKVGFTLGKYFAEHGITLTGYYSRQREHAAQAAQFTGSNCYEDVDRLVRDSDAIFVTVVDGQITQVYESIKNLGITNKYICHCSGAMTAKEAFPDISQTGAFGYSIHPLFPVSDKFTTYQKLADAFFCIEGDGEHLQEWKELLESIGLKNRVIDGSVKTKYHAAASVSSNLVVALIDEAVKLLTECGFERQEALEAMTPLVRSNIDNVLSAGPARALTGPVERNDVGTVEKHLQCLDTKEERELYRACAGSLIGVAREKNPDRDYTDMAKLLQG